MERLGTPALSWVHHPVETRASAPLGAHADSALDLRGLQYERVTGGKARGLQVEKGGCRCQTFLCLSSGRKKQTSDVFFSVQI